MNEVHSPNICTAIGEHDMLTVRLFTYTRDNTGVESEDITGLIRPLRFTAYSSKPVISMLTRLDVYRFEYIHAIGSSYYAAYVFRRYTAQLNHSHKARAISYQRLNWKQKARAIMIAEECGWYDDYYYCRG